MRNSKLIFSTLLIVLSTMTITSCKHEVIDGCTDGIMNGPETEIDCGGTCAACPPAGTVTATLEGYPFNGAQISASQGNNQYGLHVSGTGGTSMQFTCVGSALNTPLPITAAQFDDGNYNYYYELTDTGSVVITSNDLTRKIFSGHFSFSGTTAGGSYKGKVENGVFENVRY